MVGQLLSHYTIVEKIGEGGMGVVYRAHDEGLDRDVAIKILSPSLLADENARKRFKKEALTLARLNHPNIETVFEFGTQDGVSFLATELIPGESLDSKLLSGPLPAQELLFVATQLAEGLAAAHEQGIIHRDLKPGNLRLTRNGRLKIIDFGLSKLLQEELRTAKVSELSQSHEIRGTLPYMAPEQLRGLKADVRSDIWAFGTVLYEMATGNRAFPQTQSADLMVAILQESPAPPRSLNPSVSAHLEGIIAKALIKNPDERYQSAVEILSDLDGVKDKPPVSQTGFSQTSKALSIDAKLEVAHVLFMDIVAYSRLPMDQQRHVLAQLQDLVRHTTAFSQAESEDQLIRLPTGDGMALVFFGDAEAAVRCALEVTKALKEQPDISLRMGIHTGPVYRVADINASRNVAGGGINYAQRVMDCGDAGHILVSKAVADVIGEMSTWSAMLHDLGEAEVKHGVRVHLYNLYTDTVGNAQLPQKLHITQQAAATIRLKKKRKKVSFAVVTTFLALALAGGVFVYLHLSRPLSKKDTIVLGDFANTTGESVFDDTLKQGLAVSLSQSPFINLLPEQKTSHILKMMGHSASERITPELAKEICIRSGSKAILVGSISSLGSQYVIGLNATSCASGEDLAKEQVQASSREEVLKALGTAASSLREKLGESLSSVRSYAIPVEEATTASLPALQAYSQGMRIRYSNGDNAALPMLKQAVQIDPNFAMGYAALATIYSNLGEAGSSVQAAKRAYELHSKVTEREKFYIDANYYAIATGDLQKEIQVYEQWTHIYDRDPLPYKNLALGNSFLGQYERALEGYKKALQLEPNDVGIYVDLAATYINLNRLEEAKGTLSELENRKLEHDYVPLLFYVLGFLQGDDAQMSAWVSAAAAKPAIADIVLASKSDTEAIHGHLREAHRYAQLAIDSALQSEAKERASVWQAHAALRDAEYGNLESVESQATAALQSESAASDPTVALALARAGKVTRAETMAKDLSQQAPTDTLLNGYWLPSIRAAVDLDKGSPTAAIDDLEPAIPYETGGYPISLDTLYPVYLRGQALLKQKNGRVAVKEFQKLLSYRGRLANSPLIPLGLMGLARAYTLAGNVPAARENYQKLLALWTDADSDLRMLQEVKTELASLPSH